MQHFTREVVARFSGIGPRSFQAIAATDKLCSDGFALQMPNGADISRLNSGRANLLYAHADIVGKIVRAWFEPNKLMFEGQFAPQGVNELADDSCRLLKAGFLSSCSLSFNILEKRKIPGGFLATKWEALEVSLCAVPVDADAYVTQRSFRTGKVLSGANAKALRDAHDLAEQCRSTIADVLESSGNSPDAEDAIEGDRARHEYWRRQVEVMELRWAPGELEELEARDDERRAPTDYAARQRHLARITKALTK